MGDACLVKNASNSQERNGQSVRFTQVISEGRKCEFSDDVALAYYSTSDTLAKRESMSQSHLLETMSMSMDANGNMYIPKEKSHRAPFTCYKVKNISQTAHLVVTMHVSITKWTSWHLGVLDRDCSLQRPDPL
jgi:hypothetical protein